MTLRRALFTFMQSVGISMTVFTLIAFSFFNVSNPLHALDNKNERAIYITSNPIGENGFNNLINQPRHVQVMNFNKFSLYNDLKSSIK